MINSIRSRVKFLGGILTLLCLGVALCDLSIDKLKHSYNASSHEFPVIDDLIKTSKAIPNNLDIGYWVSDITKIDGLDRATLAALSFQRLPMRVHPLDSVSDAKTDYIVISRFAAALDDLEHRNPTYHIIRSTSAFHILRRDGAQEDVHRAVYLQSSQSSLFRQIATMATISLCLTLFFLWVSGKQSAATGKHILIFASFASAIIITYILPHTLRSPNGTAVYAGKAKLLYLLGSIPDDFFSSTDWDVFVPVYPPGMSLLTYVYYLLAGSCDNWIVQILPFIGTSIALFLIYISARSPLGRFFVLAFFLATSTKQIYLGFYPEGFLATSILSAIIRLQHTPYSYIGWLSAGLAPLFKMEGLVFYILLLPCIIIAFRCSLRRILIPSVCGIIPSSLWYIYTYVCDGQLNGYETPSLSIALSHLYILLHYLLEFLQNDWHGLLAIPAALIIAPIMQHLFRLRAHRTIQFQWLFISLGVIAISIAYCFCEDYNITWRIETSSFRPLWILAVVAYLCFSEIEHIVLTIVHLGKRKRLVNT